MITPEKRAEILTLLAAGGSNRSVGARAGVTPNVVAGVRFRAYGTPVGRSQADVAAAHREGRKAILDTLAQTPRRPSEVAVLTGLSRDTLSKLSGQLVRYGKITRSGHGKTLRWERI